MTEPKFLTTEELHAGLAAIRQSPENNGELKLIVRRPQINAREILTEAELSIEDGLVGDNWKHRPSSRTADGSPHPEMQINIINWRAITLIAQDESRLHLAGDQLFLDMNLSKENLPAGTTLAIGSAILEITSQPHTGCKKFVERFGLDAMKFVNSELGRELQLRGINARVVQSGIIRTGDRAIKL